MRAVVTGVIEIYGATPEELKRIKDYLSIDDPDYYKKIRMNPAARHYLSPQYKFYEESKPKKSDDKGQRPDLIVPRGAGAWLRQTFPSATFEDRTVEAPYEYETKEAIVLRENQEGIPEAITKARQGLAVLPTGFGKSILAIDVIRRLGQRGLVVVPTKPIQDQFVSDIQRYLGFDARRPAAPIRVVTPRYIVSQVLRRAKGAPSEFDPGAYGVVCYDECHGAVADGARTIWRYLPARYRYGFTGTLERTDGKGPAIPFYFGSVLVERTQTLATPSIILHQYRGGGAVDVYHKMTQALSEDEERNAAIVEVVQNLKGKTLVLTKRVEHYKALTEMMPGNLKVFRVDSDMTTKERNTLLTQLRKDAIDYDVILGTFALLATGLDIPALDNLVIAGDLKSSVLHKQAAGRILRLFGDKKPVIHDIVDVSNPILYRQAKARQKVYKLNNWPTTVCPMKSNATPTLFPKDLAYLFES